MYIPVSTYRIQLSDQFTFKDLKEILPYLHELGISTIYASPILQARPGSQHGYDGINPDKINPEIGDEAEFEAIGRNLKDMGMGWLQDIVPNHLAFHPLNPWLRDIFEKGPKSLYYHFFDVNWNHPDYQGKIMAPFLGGPMKEVLSRNEISVTFNEDGFHLKYYEHEYPVSIPSYESILNQGAQYLTDEYDQINDVRSTYSGLLDNLGNIIHFEEVIDERWESFKKSLYHNYQSNTAFSAALDKAIETINKDHATLSYLLGQQYFVLTHWQASETSINYRRFFTINDLICLDINHSEVFEQYHRGLKRLAEKGLIQGLRIDHIDGLFNPGLYLRRIKNHFGRNTYLVVEKILEWEESLPVYWPSQGATGYGFLATISHLFTDWRNRGKITRIYQSIIGHEPDYRQLVAEKKQFVLKKRMGGELNNLFHQMKMLNLFPSREEELAPDKLKEALATFLVMHPVYRIYPTQYPLHVREVNILRRACNEAIRWKPELEHELTFLFRLFTETPEEDELYEANKLYFLMRCQQFTGPLEAKGVEDTTFYLYNRLISHNEVGDTPELFGISQDEFHERMIERQALDPYALNATATHDTKRGEDMRVRINVISEIPDEWEENVKHWMKLNEPFVKTRDGVRIPDYNDEYFLYQTLCGAFPMNGEIEENFAERIKEYMTKALREGKKNSNWSAPNQIYEYGVFDFINQILNPDHKFLSEARPFIKKLTNFGMIYSLAQLILKLTVPGVPDTFQGRELWDLSLVDPDNRRPVDYELRKRLLAEMKQEKDELQLTRRLLQERENGRIKLYTFFKAINARKANYRLFQDGAYIPGLINGSCKDCAVGFYRNLDNQWSLTMAPQNLSSLLGEDWGSLNGIWNDTAIQLPDKAPAQWRNIFTGQTYEFKNIIHLNPIFADYPVVFLMGETK